MRTSAYIESMIENLEPVAHKRYEGTLHLDYVKAHKDALIALHPEIETDDAATELFFACWNKRDELQKENAPYAEWSVYHSLGISFDECVENASKLHVTA